VKRFLTSGLLVGGAGAGASPGFGHGVDLIRSMGKGRGQEAGERTRIDTDGMDRGGDWGESGTGRMTAKEGAGVGTADGG